MGDSARIADLRVLCAIWPQTQPEKEGIGVVAQGLGGGEPLPLHSIFFFLIKVLSYFNPQVFDCTVGFGVGCVCVSVFFFFFFSFLPVLLKGREQSVVGLSCLLGSAQHQRPSVCANAVP